LWQRRRRNPPFSYRANADPSVRNFLTQERFPVTAELDLFLFFCFIHVRKYAPATKQTTATMKRITERNDQQNGRPPDKAARKNRARDADILVLLWEAMRARGNEIDSLLDLSLSILASTSDFPQRADVEASLKKAQGLLRSLT
jgi:hypothetical protein